MDNTNQIQNNQFQGISNVPIHIHNGVDSPLIQIKNVTNIFYGLVNAAGTAGLTTRLPTGWTATVSDAGAPNWIVTHNLNTTAYSVVLQNIFNGTQHEALEIQLQSKDSFLVHFWGIAGSGNVICSFNFILIKL